MEKKTAGDAMVCNEDDLKRLVESEKHKLRLSIGYGTIKMSCGERELCMYSHNLSVVQRRANVVKVQSRAGESLYLYLMDESGAKEVCGSLFKAMEFEIAKERSSHMMHFF